MKWRKMMGLADIVVLHDIYKEACRLEKEFNWGFDFNVDDGDFETAIEFFPSGIFFHPPAAHNWQESRDKGTTIKCPDILDWNNKIIIEYEEESRPGKKSGKFGRKGHTEESKRDMERDALYSKAQFSVLKIWGNDYDRDVWKPKLKEFLMESFRSTIKVPT